MWFFFHKYQIISTTRITSGHKCICDVVLILLHQSFNQIFLCLGLFSTRNLLMTILFRGLWWSRSKRSRPCWNRPWGNRTRRSWPRRSRPRWSWIGGRRSWRSWTGRFQARYLWPGQWCTGSRTWRCCDW